MRAVALALAGAAWWRLRLTAPRKDTIKDGKWIPSYDMMVSIWEGEADLRQGRYWSSEMDDHGIFVFRPSPVLAAEGAKPRYIGETRWERARRVTLGRARRRS